MKAKNIGLFSVIFTSICCVGPLLLILLGLGTLGIGAVIGKYHWWFLGAGISLIIVAWRYYFREKSSCDLKGCQMENKKQTLVILIIATIIVAFFAGLNLYTYAGKSTKEKSFTSSANLKTMVIPIEGMTCLTCELTVSSSLKKINGVIEATASAREKNAKVTYDTTKTDKNKLIEAINRTGYRVGLSK